jgi:IclR family transcriptional regulator, acetate operon repressor
MIYRKPGLKSSSNHPDGNKTNTVESVHRAINVLVCLSNGYHSVTDIANKCQLSNSTVHRLLQALQESDAVIEDPASRRYYLGCLLGRLTANPHITHEHLLRCADREMQRLASHTQETVSLLTLIGLKQQRLRSIPSSYSLRVVDISDEDSLIGDIYIGAPARVLLSQLTDDKLRKTLRYLKLDNETSPESVAKDIEVQVRAVQRQGYAITQGEKVSGGLCISVPISNYFLPVSLNIYGPGDRLKPKMKDHLNQALQSACQISNNIKKAV